MARILVSTIVSDGQQVLLAQNRAGEWNLPGGVLLDEDDSIEACVSRILKDDFGLTVEVQEFFDTYRETAPGASQPVLRNVSLVSGWSGIPTPPPSGDCVEVRWLPLGRLNELDVDEATRRALREGLGVQPGEAAAPGAPIIFISGPPAAGKSSVSRLLCMRLERSAHIQVDLIRHMIVGGYASPVPGRSDPFSAAQQNELMLANLAALARNFSLAGFHTIIDNVITSPEELDLYLEPFTGLAQLYVVTLLPSVAVLLHRDGHRAAEVRQGERTQVLHRLIGANDEMPGLRVDSSAMSVEETVDYILANLEVAKVL